MAGDDKGKSRYGRENQHVTPAWSSWHTRQVDGHETITYGRQGQSEPHGHTDRDTDGNIEFARTIDGREVKKS